MEQKEKILDYMSSEYKTDIQTAMNEISTINQSLKNLKEVMSRLF